MKLIQRKPREFINSLLSKKSISRPEFEVFKTHLKLYKASIDQQHEAKQSEPNIVSNALKPFVDSLGYTSHSYTQKGQSGIDLAILHNGNPSVLFEIKKHKSTDMISCAKPNTKAFHEAILYFMRERDKGNQSIFHIVISDFYQWFIFDAKDFDRLFWNDKTINALFRAYSNPSLLGDTTKEFYLAVQKAVDGLKLDLLEEQVLECAVFDLSSVKDEKDLIAIYKLLSADSLLKQFNPNDANSLNRDFYNELLYILGLEEQKENGKRIISRAKKPQDGSLFENITRKLDQYDKKSDFETVIRLLIIWINRILFLKLLESQIVKWTGNKNNKFLNIDKIAQYEKLEELFFEILAKPISVRRKHEFDYVPYLNSSLFEINPEEKNGITVASLSNEAKVFYYSRTAISDSHGRRKSGAINTLAYLFEFLDAFDFGDDGNLEVVSESKPLINASVLGLIFEKINGYKDGSFYTPSFITMYMSRESIRLKVIEKFNQEFIECQASSWQELQRYCESRCHLEDFLRRAVPLVDSITICDPAVGSGHFLVSALNEIVFSKFELGIFSHRGLRLELINDELLIDLNDEWFEYRQPESLLNTNHLLQKKLFEEKQRIIENQLFGVDINPNSTQITKLRLWIELLKHSYYDENDQLVTLPNIDINIKTGNSLISRFDLTDEIKNKNIKEQIAGYKVKVKEYKENVGSKRDVMASILDIKDQFNKTLKSRHTSTRGLDQKLIEYITLFGYASLSKDLRTLAFEAMQGQNDMFGADQEIASKNKSKSSVLLVKLNELLKRVQNLENGKIYDDAFEWRFEFPEVLDEGGDYTGFDIVIGNPPYGVKLSDSEKINYLEKYLYQDYQLDTYLIFIERGLQILKASGCFSFIVPNTWLTNLKLKKMRIFLSKENYISEIAHYKSAVFDEAVVDTQAIFLKKINSKNPEIRIKVVNSPTSELILSASQQDWANRSNDPINIFLDGAANALKLKLEANTKRLGDISNVVIGAKPYQVGKGKPAQTREMVKGRIFDAEVEFDESYKPLLRGSDIQPYEINWDGRRWIKYGAWLAEPRKSAKFDSPKKLVVRQTGDTLIGALDVQQFVCMNNLHVITSREGFDIPLEYLLALINSKVFDYYHYLLNPEKGEALAEVKKENLEKMPVRMLSKFEQLPIINLVNEIMEGNPNKTLLLNELDTLIFGIYDLTEEEVAAVTLATLKRC